MVVAVVAVINAVAITLLEIVTIPTTAVINAEKKGILAVIVMNNPKKIERKRAIHVVNLAICLVNVVQIRTRASVTSVANKVI